jgi:hypothetical protein
LALSNEQESCDERNCPERTGGGLAWERRVKRVALCYREIFWVR